MDLTPPHAVGLVGGGLASLSAAQTLRQLGYDGDLFLITDEAHAPYDRPPLSKDVLRGALDSTKTTLLGPDLASELGVELMLGDRVTAVETGSGALRLDSGRELKVDRVLLATGGRARSLPVPGGDLAGVSTLRTVEDAEALRTRLLAGGPVVVVGGGFIGLEVAAVARSLGCDVTVVEAAERLLVRVLPAAAAHEVEILHRLAGIHFELGASITALEGAGEVQAVLLSDGRRLPASCVVVGIGMVPATDLADEAGLVIGDGIWTDAGATTSHPHVLAAGDVAYAFDPWHGRHIRSEQWQSAQAQGTAAAHTMLGRPAPAAPVPWFWSDQADLRLQVAGTPGPGQRVVERGGGGPAGRSWFHLDDQGRLVAAVSLQRVQDVRGAMALMKLGAPVSDEVLSDESQDLRRVARTLAKAR